MSHAPEDPLGKLIATSCRLDLPGGDRLPTSGSLGNPFQFGTFFRSVFQHILVSHFLLLELILSPNCQSHHHEPPLHTKIKR